jgi:hypothetical protein
VRVVPGVVNSRLRDTRFALSFSLSLSLSLSLSPSSVPPAGPTQTRKVQRSYVGVSDPGEDAGATQRGGRTSRHTRSSPGRAQRVSGFRACKPEVDRALRTYALRRAFPLSGVATLRVGIVGRRGRCRRCIDREASSAARPRPRCPDAPTSANHSRRKRGNGGTNFGCNCNPMFRDRGE